MGCGCNKKKGTEEKPILAGLHNGAAPVKAVLRVSAGGASAGDTVWVTGSGIADWVRLGYLELTDSLVETP